MYCISKLFDRLQIPFAKLGQSTERWLGCAVLAGMAAAAQAGTLTIVDLPVGGTDAAIGISTDKTYTHAFDFGTAGGSPVTINGVAMDQGPTENQDIDPYIGTSSQGYGYILGDTRPAVNFNPHEGNDASAQATGDSLGMLTDMIYFSGADVGEGMLITLEDLTPGATYEVRWYYRAWDAGERTITFKADGGSHDDFADEETIDIDGGGAHYLQYEFVSDDTDVTLNFECTIDNQGAHVYGLTCELVAEPGPTCPPIPAMEAYYPLDDGAGTTAVDEVGGNNGTLMGGLETGWTTGYLDGGLSFDPDGDPDNQDNMGYIEVPHSSAIDFGTESFSISFLVRQTVSHPNPDPLGFNENRYFSKGSFSGAGDGGVRYELYNKDGVIRFGLDDDVTKTEAVVDPADSIVTGDWVHVVCVRDTVAVELRVYADGVLVGSIADGTGSVSNPHPLWIGTNQVGDKPAALGFLNADMDDFRIFRTVLTEQDIANIAEIHEGCGDGPGPEPNRASSWVTYQ